MSVVLEVSGVDRWFGGLQTLADVSLRLGAGERRAVIGPNGAGKSTLLHVISGVLPPSAGHVRLLDRDVTRTSAHRRSRMGVARTFQVTTLLPKMTVAENVALALQARRMVRFDFLRPAATYRSLWRDVAAMLDTWGLADHADIPVATLSYGEQRKLEVILAVATEPRVILLDEPAAGLSHDEAMKMVELIRGLGRDVGVLFIEHDLELAFDLADTVTVLHQGRVVADGTPDEVRASSRVQDIYLGTAG